MTHYLKNNNYKKAYYNHKIIPCLWQGICFIYCFKMLTNSAEVVHLNKRFKRS